MPRWLRLLFGSCSLGFGSVIYYQGDQWRWERVRRRKFERMRKKFLGQEKDANEALVSRAIGGLGNNPGITYPAKLHRDESEASHQYAGKPKVVKTGLQAQCVSVINAETQAGPFPGVGDLYYIDDDSVVLDIHGVPAIYSGDAATQLKSSRTLDLSGPKHYSVAYVRREHHLPPGIVGSRFTDKYSVDQLLHLADLANYQQRGKHNEIVANLSGKQLCGTFFFLKEPDDPVERRNKEFEVIQQRTMHRLRAGWRALDDVPVVEIRKNKDGSLDMIQRDDLATSSFVFEYHHLLGTMPEQQRQTHVTDMCKSFFFAKSPAKEKPFTQPNWTTYFYAKFFMLSCTTRLPRQVCMNIESEVDELVRIAERERQARKDKFCLYQAALSTLAPQEQLTFRQIIANNDFEKQLDFIREDDKTPYYKLDYHSSKEVRSYKVAIDGRPTYLVVAPVGYNQNWRFPDDPNQPIPQRHLKPRVFETE